MLVANSIQSLKAFFSEKLSSSLKMAPPIKPERDNSFNKGYARIAISANDPSYSTFDGDNWDICFVAPLKG